MQTGERAVETVRRSLPVVGITTLSYDCVAAFPGSPGG